MQDAVATLLTIKIGLIIAWMACLFLAERLIPAAPMAPAAHPRQRLISNAVLWGVNAALSPLAVLPLTAWAAGLAFPWRPAWWSGWGGLALDLLILDGLIYGWHRLNHEAPFLWRFHSVHHLDRFLDTTSAVRFHFGEILISAAARAAVVILLAIPLASVLVFDVLLLLATIFHHSNLRLPPALERALSRAIVTPSIHWVHHHRRRGDTDSNYSTILSIWDPLFRTRSPTRRTPDLVIGVEGREEEGLAGLFAAPFRPRRSRYLDSGEGRGSVQ